MTFSKEILRDEDWASIDFDLLNNPYLRRPGRPRDWAVDREQSVAILPATEHYDARDGTQRFLLIDSNRTIWLHFDMHPPTIRWSLWLGATAVEIQRTNTTIAKALSAYFGDSFAKQRPCIEFDVRDPFHVETLEELIHRFNRTISLAQASARLTFPNRDAKLKEKTLHYANLCFSEEQRMRLLNHYWNASTPRFDPEAVTTLVWLSESQSLLHRLRFRWRRLFA